MTEAPGEQYIRQGAAWEARQARADEINQLRARVAEFEGVLFGGPAGGSMADTTNEVGPAAEGLTLETLMEAKAWLDAGSPLRLAEWATPDLMRLKTAWMQSAGRYRMSDSDLKAVHTMKFYGAPVIVDEKLPADVFIEMRDQHGNCLGRVMAS